MKGVLVDSNVIMDVFLNDVKWADWSESKLEEYGDHKSLYINSIIYSEISIGFKLIEDLESAINKAGSNYGKSRKRRFFSRKSLYKIQKKRRGKKHTTA